MFKSITMSEALQRVASPEEWEEYEDLRGRGYTRPIAFVLGAPEGPYERQATRFMELESVLWTRVRDNLLIGTWYAEGFIPPHGSQPQLIHRHLWRVLERDWDLTGVTGSGIYFVNLLISEAVPARKTGAQREKASLRRQLMQWIELEAKASARPTAKADLFALARKRFKGKPITPNLFSDAWRSADLPEEARHKGRPKK
jgi:hypothetical protein